MAPATFAQLGDVFTNLVGWILGFAGIVLFVVREDQPGDRRLVAYLTSQIDQEIAIASIRSHLSAILPE